jgi:hypothetical protein
VYRCVQLAYVASVKHWRLHQFSLHPIIILSPNSFPIIHPQRANNRCIGVTDHSREAVGRSCAKG